MTTTIAVTGAAGHIGRSLLEHLPADTRIRAIDLVPRPSGLPRGIDWVRADVRDRRMMTESLSGVDVVYHLAAVISISEVTAARAWDVNVAGAEATARAARDARVSRFVHCSSIHAFDCSAVEQVTERSPRSVADHLPIYDRSKAAGEARIRAVAADGLDVVVVHPGGVIGPGDHVPSLMGQMLRQVMAGTLPAVVRAKFEWVDVRDVAGGLVSAAEKGSTGRSYLLGGHFLGVDRLAGLVARESGVRAPRTVPMWVADVGARLLSRMSDSGLSELLTPDAIAALRYGRRVDDEPARRDFGYAPRPLAETVRDTVEWIQGVVQGSTGAVSPWREWSSRSARLRAARD